MNVAERSGAQPAATADSLLAGSALPSAWVAPFPGWSLVAGAAAFSPLVSHRVLEYLSLNWDAPPWNMVALHLLPPLSMLTLSLLLWRVIPPLDYSGRSERRDRPGYRGLCVAAGMLLGLMAAVANLLAMLAAAGGEPAMASVSPTSAALVAHVLLLAPVAEEAAFRGLLYRYMRRLMVPALATIASALIFALMHANLIQCVWALVLGLVAAMAYEQTQSLLTPIIIHGLFNSVPIGVAVARSNPTDTGPIWLIICVVAVIFTLAARSAGQGEPAPWE